MWNNAFGNIMNKGGIPIVMDSAPLISVIVPVYNAESYLQRCMKSLLSQTYTNIEVLLINDGSTDGSGMVCDSFAEKDMRVCVIHQANGGASSARNAGLNAARGLWVGFVDADDFIDAAMYERMLQAALESGKHLVSCGHYEQRRDGERRYINIPGNYINLPGWNAPKALSGVEALKYALRFRYFSGSVWSILFDRAVLDGGENPPLRMDTGLHNNEDVEFLIRTLLRANGVAIVPEALYCYFQSEISASRTFTARHLTVIDAWEKIIEHVTPVSVAMAQSAKITHTETVFDLIRCAVQQKKHELLPELCKAARRYIKECLAAKEVRLRRKILFVLILTFPRLFVPVREKLRALFYRETA